MNKFKISILGLGWYGAPLARELNILGHAVFGSTRSEEKKQNFLLEKIHAEITSYPESPSENLLLSDIVILNIPPFPEQLNWFKKFNWHPNTWMIFISSTGAHTPDSKNGDLLREEEAWVQNHFKKWTILRFGGLLGNGRHPGKSLSGKKNLSGRLWPVNLIHLDDCIGFTKIVIEEKIQGQIFHVVSDDHRSREEFYTEYCKAHGLPLPEFNSEDNSQREPISNLDMKKFYPSFNSLR